MRTAPEGLRFIVAAWAVAGVLAAVGWWIAFWVWLPVAVWVVAFFRNPGRGGSRGDALILAPADGKVVDVRATDEPVFLAGPAVRVSIFMNVFDCHVNQYPVNGIVAYRQYNAGKFLHAASEKSSLDNEQSSVGLMTDRGKVLVRQIAGLVARRIVTDHSVGAEVKQGERMGMIRFGSRVDLFLPLTTRVLVRPGEKTRVGVTVVAQWD